MGLSAFIFIYEYFILTIFNILSICEVSKVV